MHMPFILGLDYVPIMLAPLHGQGLSPLFPLLLCTVLGYSLGTIYGVTSSQIHALNLT